MTTKGKAIDPVEKSLDIITPYGRSGDAIQQALKEWYEFQESYDPDYLLATNEPDIPGIPNQYEYTYSCYTQEMVDKVDEIAAKYNLKLLDEWIPFQRYQSDIFLEETRHPIPAAPGFRRTDYGYGGNALSALQFQHGV